MAQALEDIQNLNRKRQLAYDEAQEERREDLIIAIKKQLGNYIITHPNQKASSGDYHIYTVTESLAREHAEVVLALSAGK